MMHCRRIPARLVMLQMRTKPRYYSTTPPVYTDIIIPRITVCGLGGAGGNTVNNMISKQFTGADFLVANTDAQALSLSSSAKRVQLGRSITRGLGAGAKPNVGRQSAEESLQDVLSEIGDSNMIFVTAGMGGGTGTGAAPVIANAAKQKGILTVGIVTKPFNFEGRSRMRLAEEGLAELEQAVDTLIVIPNQKLLDLENKHLSFIEAFHLVDDVLYNGIKGVTDVLVKPGLVNLDFADVRTIMTDMGRSLMGTGEGEGRGRARQAAEQALHNPLLEDMSIQGARGVLINVASAGDSTLFEVDEIVSTVSASVDPEANIIFGSSVDPDLQGKIRVTLIVTGMNMKPAQGQPQPNANQQQQQQQVSAQQQQRNARTTPARPTQNYQTPYNRPQQQAQQQQQQNQQAQQPNQGAQPNVIQDAKKLFNKYW